MLEAWLQQFTQFGYLGIFIISFIGSVSVIFPIPYTLVIFGLGSVLDPVLVAIIGGLGAALGEFSGYAVGYYGNSKISEKNRKKMDVGGVFS